VVEQFAEVLESLGAHVALAGEVLLDGGLEVPGIDIAGGHIAHALDALGVAMDRAPAALGRPDADGAHGDVEGLGVLEGRPGDLAGVPQGQSGGRKAEGGVLQETTAGNVATRHGHDSGGGRAGDPRRHGHHPTRRPGAHNIPAGESSGGTRE